MTKKFNKKNCFIFYLSQGTRGLNSQLRVFSLQINEANFDCRFFEFVNYGDRKLINFSKIVNFLIILCTQFIISTKREESITYFNFLNIFKDDILFAQGSDDDNDDADVADDDGDDDPMSEEDSPTCTLRL